MDVAALRGTVLIVVRQQVSHRRERVAGTRDDVQEHRVRDAETRLQRLRLGGAEPLERRAAPRNETLGRLLPYDLAPLALVVTDLRERFLVLDHVLGRLHDDGTHRVETGPTSATGDLMELPRLQQSRLCAVELRQGREQYRADRHVDADAERVRTADHLQLPGLRERLHEAAISRQHPGVVYADAVPYQSREHLAESCG